MPGRPRGTKPRPGLRSRLAVGPPPPSARFRCEKVDDARAGVGDQQALLVGRKGKAMGKADPPKHGRWLPKRAGAAIVFENQHGLGVVVADREPAARPAARDAVRNGEPVRRDDRAGDRRIAISRVQQVPGDVVDEIVADDQLDQAEPDTGGDDRAGGLDQVGRRRRRTCGSGRARSARRGDPPAARRPKPPQSDCRRPMFDRRARRRRAAT